MKELERLAREQAALRRVATLVARAAPEPEVLAAIAEELGRLMEVDHVRTWRFENGTATTVASAGTFEAAMPVGVREPLYDYSLAGRVRRTGRSQRVDDYAATRGPIGERALEIGMGCGVAIPIVVEGRLWGAMVAAARQAWKLAPDTEARMSEFTALMATAIANTESRARAERLAEEQAALRRVAMLVATEASPAEVFAEVAEEVATLFGAVECSVYRDEHDGTATLVGVGSASAGVGDRIGQRFPADGGGVVATVLRTGRPHRVDDYAAITGTLAALARDEFGVGSGVGCPIVVGGRVWGAIGAMRLQPRAFPPEAEAHLARFAELVATAVANADARAEVTRLADEQAALRRVATLVAQGAAPTAVFDAVAEEMAALLAADAVVLGRYEDDEEITAMAHRGPRARRLPPGARVHHEEGSASARVRSTRRPVRVESYADARGAIGEAAKELGIRSSVGVPVVVDGRLWGVTLAMWTGEVSPSADTEERMVQFAALLDIAIANADGRAQLGASRARLLTEADEARRRVVRDLHDGAQQRLVHTILTLKLALRAFGEPGADAEPLVRDALDQAESANAELRELAHGILPAVLSRGGLRAGVGAFVERLDLPVSVDVPAERFSAEIEASAYFIVAEALTNVVKHSRAGRAAVRAHVEGATLHVEIRDDGAGGADPRGHGLIGLSDRATALGGRLEIESPPGGGTRVAARLPLQA
jgi:signal transduction histidine kinase